ncbi:uncharacterized protein [Battus philenor]|uniref:uncharacterized protein n=1 Tax=Battus philenor TaxID=42288 RepID=UPI0035D0046E
MSVTNAMFIFEVVVESVKSLTSSTALVIRSDFADIFSLELKDPKQMHIVMPEPLPLPPEPPGKKKKKPKPKPAKKKKGQVDVPPPEPVIQSGQSVLFSSCAEVLSQNMQKFPLEISLWNKEDYLVYIGSVSIPWDPIFLKYLEKLYNCQEAPPVTLNEEYNVFEEGTAKLIAKLGIQIKLSYLGDKVVAAFRTLSEDPTIKKVLYTGMNSKTTSYMCTMKTTDEVFEENCNKIENNYTVDKPRPTAMVYADYKNAPLPKYNIFNEGDYCCMGNADKPPNSIYKAPETCPDIDFIIEYVRKIITSCYDNMRMLTPRPTIKPRVKATDIDRLCYCKETNWPQDEFAQRFKRDVQAGPCPLCAGPREKPKDPTTNIETFDIANIRGTCGRHDCKVARLIRAYIENLVEEDNKIIKIDDVTGPCGSKECTLAEKIQQFLRQEGPFDKISTLEALSTQCACLQKMRENLIRRKAPKRSNTSSSDESAVAGESESENDKDYCKKKGCPFGGNADPTQVYNVYYFFVQYDKDKELSSPEDSTTKFQYCTSECPSVKASEKTSCSKSACSSKKDQASRKSKMDPEESQLPSPDDSNVVICFDDIHNPCCVKSCNVVETVKDLIVQGAQSEKKICLTDVEDPCYCDCTCTFKFSKKTTYCAVCGGYECMGDDLKDMPEYAKPYPCPVYNKLYDKKYIKVTSPWPDDEAPQKPMDNISVKSAKGSKSSERRMRSTKSVSDRKLGDRKSDKSEHKIRSSQKVSSMKVKPKKEEKKKQKEKEKKVVPKVEKIPPPQVEKPPEKKYPYPPVPKNMGWNWTADDIPGMKVRPKWRPGAVNKILVRRYRAMREGIDTIAKKKRALMQRKKKLEMKPTLVVKKNNGEYTVQMEVFKKYSKERLAFQYPYEEKPPLMYTIGKTEEEQIKVQKQRERKERRETRRKSRLLQSTFRNKCQEICLKAYNQAIGLLPLPDPNNPDCPCQTDAVKPITPPIDSCSCSEDENISSSDTDNDEWVIEFTPPLARWDPKMKHPPVPMDNECQYNYLDFKVKLLDKSGNPVPRFFKGPDGKQECSDLGGFWDPSHIWMEINKDGYIGPDNRWVPMNFVGPDGMFYSAEEGFFTDNSGRTLKIGIDGYIEKDGKWAWYSNRKSPKSVKSKTVSSAATGDSRKAKIEKPPAKTNGGGDKKAAAAKTKDKSTPKNAPPPAVKPGKEKANKVGFGTSKAKNPLIMSVSVDRVENKPFHQEGVRYNAEPYKTDKYSEIMQQIYDDVIELKLPTKANRASNTVRKNFSTYAPSRKFDKIRLIKSIVNDSNTTSGT